jgi:hypothetical protein
MTYDTIIFLNNAAVTLLECEQYQESLMTFRDAMYVKQMLYSQQQKSTTSKSLGQIFRRIVHDATKRLAKSQKKNVLLSTFQFEEKIITLNIMDDDCFVNILQYHQFLDKVDFVFRIDKQCDEEYKTCDDSRHWELNSAILLYNYAIACKRAGVKDRRQVSDDDESTCCELLDKSMNHLILTKNILMVELEIFSLKIKEQRGYTKDELETLLRIIIVAMFTTNHLSDFSNYFYMTQEWVEYKEKYKNLLLLFVNIVQEYLKHPITLAKHAAAA